MCKFNDKIVDLPAFLIKFVLTKVQDAVVGSSAFIFEAGGLAWTLWIQKELSVLRVALETEHQRKLLVISTLNKLIELLEPHWICFVLGMLVLLQRLKRIFLL